MVRLYITSQKEHQRIQRYDKYGNIPIWPGSGLCAACVCVLSCTNRVHWDGLDVPDANTIRINGDLGTLVASDDKRIAAPKNRSAAKQPLSVRLE